VAKRILLFAYSDFLGGEPPADRTLSAYHLEDLLRLCREGQDGDVSDLLPHGAKACLRDGCLCFSLPTAPSVPLSPEPRPLFEGDTLWDAGSADTPAILVRVEASPTPLPPLEGSDVPASAVFPRDLLPLPLYARPRRAGDVILSHGMTKHLKKLLCDKGVPLSLRDRLPLILLPDAETPLWYPPAAFRAGFPPPKDGACLRVTLLFQKAEDSPKKQNLP
jgi:tRNA(Ile)-lysidine synthetase-like protein